MFEKQLAEIDQQAEFSPAEPKLGEQSLGVNGNKVLDGLQFHDHQVFHDQVGAKSHLELEAIIDDRERHFAVHVQPALAQFIGENHFINRFEQSRSEVGMNMECRIDYDFGDFIFVHFSALPLRLCAFA